MLFRSVLDSGANDHMTGELSLFSSLLTLVNQTVSIADGSITRVQSKGDVCLSPDITLTSVLHVPQLSFNLLSVSRLAKSHDCAVIFLPDRCLLQDLNSKRIFGTGHERDGLYFFGEPPPPLVSSNLQASVLPPSASSSFSNKTIDLWHARLGHANFQ